MLALLNTTLKISLLFLFFLGGCQSTSERAGRKLLFNEQAYHRLRGSLGRFLDGKDPYGKIARDIKIGGRSVVDIESEVLATEVCEKSVQPIVEYQTKKAKKVKMLVYLCKDGSLFRLKNQGNPGDSYHPEPHGTKEVVFSIRKNISDFDSVAFKVDDEGWPQPKWPKDLKKKADVKKWSRLTHLPLKN